MVILCKYLHNSQYAQVQLWIHSIQWRTQEICSGRGGGFNKFSWGQRTERTGIWGRQPPSQGFWRQLWFGTRNIISYSKTFLIFDTLKLFMMTTNLFVIANVKQLRTGRSFIEFYCLFSEHLGVLAPYIQQFLTLFTVGVSFARFWIAFGISGGGGLNNPTPPPGYATDSIHNFIIYVKTATCYGCMYVDIIAGFSTLN